MVKACDILKVEYPAPVVSIAETTADEWTNDQRNSQCARQERVHLAVAWHRYDLKESSGRKGHRSGTTDAHEGPENDARVQRASVGMYNTMKSQYAWIGRAVGAYSSSMDWDAPQPAEKAMNMTSEARSAVLRPMWCPILAQMTRNPYILSI